MADPASLAVSVLSLAVSGWVAWKSLPQRIYHHLAEIEDVARTAQRHTQAFKDEKIARDTAFEHFIEEAEDLLGTAQRKQRRAAASLSKVEKAQAHPSPGMDTPSPDAGPMSEDDLKAALAMKHLQ